jgi:predicted unusual protein kinase regulating ubiquinone biosynthesis (AarF/ABC1/UbiB family)
MKKIYEKVQTINENLQAEGLHHNDLHSGNIMIRPSGDKSPLPEIVIVDFGEASLGPKKPLYRSCIKMSS